MLEALAAVVCRPLLRERELYGELVSPTWGRGGLVSPLERQLMPVPVLWCWGVGR